MARLTHNQLHENCAKEMAAFDRLPKDVRDALNAVPGTIKAARSMVKVHGANTGKFILEQYRPGLAI